MRTKKPIETLPYDKEQAQKLIAHIVLNFRAPEEEAYSYREMIENTLRHIMNNSGVDMEFVNNLIDQQIKKSQGA
jgi:hypothetical protein